MQAINVQGISPTSAPSHPSIETNGHYMELARSAGLRVALHLFRENLGHKWRIWWSAFRSFRGHIRTQSAKGLAMAPVGSLRHHGNLNERSLVRRIYIEKLATTLHWVDCQDLELFLMGFDAGENWASRTHSGYTDQRIESPSWLTPEITNEINITLDMLKRHWYKSQYESPRHSDPSQSD